MTKDEYIQRKALEEKDKALWNKSRSRFIPGLPVDADAKEFRRKIGSVGSCIDRLVEGLLKEQNPFFDEIMEKWDGLFPDLPAKPKEWSDGKLILHVPTSGQLFSMRAKLPAIRKALSAFPSAPKRWTIHLKIQKV
jgi:hypothetical protein